MSAGRRRLWTVASGNGGVGKSYLTASMGVALARANKSVLLVDANLASPFLHTCLGVKAPAVTLMDVLDQPNALSDALIPTPMPRMHLLTCAADELGRADLAPGEHQRMVEFLSTLEADYVLVDTGSGASLSVLDFFNLADEAILVTVPEPASMQAAYRFLKHAIYRRLQSKFGSAPGVAHALQQMQKRTDSARPQTITDFFDLIPDTKSHVIESIAEIIDNYRPLMLINMAASDQDQRMAEIVLSAARKFLNIDVRICGLIQADPCARKSAQHMCRPDQGRPEGASARQIREMVLRLAGDATLDSSADCQVWPSAMPAIPTMGLNDNLVFMGKDLHVQTEDLGDAGYCITTNVFCEGRVILTTKSEYSSTLRETQYSSQVAEMMRKQHFNVIREIESRKSGTESVPV